MISYNRHKKTNNLDSVFLTSLLFEFKSIFVFFLCAGATLEIITDRSQEGAQFVKGFGGIGGKTFSYLALDVRYFYIKSIGDVRNVYICGFGCKNFLYLWHWM